MYKKTLIPLDGSRESEDVFPLIKEELAPDGEVILLQVLPPGGTRISGDNRDEGRRHESIGYLHDVARKHGDSLDQWRCEVITYKSVVEGIVDFAVSEGVDFIALYTQNSEALAALIRESIIRDVASKTPIEVKAFKPRGLVTAI